MRDSSSLLATRRLLLPDLCTCVCSFVLYLSTSILAPSCSSSDSIVPRHRQQTDICYLRRTCIIPGVVKIVVMDRQERMHVASTAHFDILPQLDFETSSLRNPSLTMTILSTDQPRGRRELEIRSAWSDDKSVLSRSNIRAVTVIYYLVFFPKT